MLRAGPLSTTSLPPAGYTLFTVSLGKDSSLHGAPGKAPTAKSQPSHLQTSPQTEEPTAEECENVGVGSFVLRAPPDQNTDLRHSSVTSAPGGGSGLRKVTMRAADREGNDPSASMAKSVPPS